MAVTPPKTPPPRPPPLPDFPDLKPSSFAMKMRLAPDNWAYQPPVAPPRVDPLAARTGVYFFYGSLLDPSMLKDILGLPDEPDLRPAFVVGYQCRLWGQYPALLDGPTGAVVEGAAYEVTSQADAEKLAYYETAHYRATACRIGYSDGAEPADTYGSVFLYTGNQADLSDGRFDLGAWLRSVGRYKALEKLEAKKAVEPPTFDLVEKDLREATLSQDTKPPPTGE